MSRDGITSHSAQDWCSLYVRNLHKTSPVQNTQWFVFWFITLIKEDCRVFKPHQTRALVFQNRNYEIIACYGTLYLLWWTVGEEFGGILGRMEYFLPGRRRRRRLKLKKDTDTGELSWHFNKIINKRGTVTAVLRFLGHN